MSHRLPAAIVAVLAAASCGCGTTTRPAQPAKQSIPAPPSGAAVFSHEEGEYVLGLGVAPRGRRLLLQASVADRQGRGVSGLRVAFSVLHGRDIFVKAVAAPCGPGCYRARVAVAHPQQVEVDVRGTDAETAWLVKLPANLFLRAQQE